MCVKGWIPKVLHEQYEETGQAIPSQCLEVEPGEAIGLGGQDGAPMIKSWGS